jgi:hypothetical protein
MMGYLENWKCNKIVSFFRQFKKGFAKPKNNFKSCSKSKRKKFIHKFVNKRDFILLLLLVFWDIYR